MANKKTDIDESAILARTQSMQSKGDASGSDPQTAANAKQSDEGRSRVIGVYKLLQRIGEGGMGEVWMAEQDKPVKRRVALKLIKAGLDNKQIIARFQAERQALAMMNHQNIAKVLDAGATEDGSPFFVMELVQGIPLNRYCDQNKLSISERLDLFIPICRALQHAHQKGIIHRDLKPSNVLVSLYDGKPVPKVIDFGLAKALQSELRLTDDTMFTEFGQVVGTLQYMSPEQAELNQLDIDTRTDVYSLGVILYELLTGTTPIESETLKQNAVLQVLATIREKEPPSPSARLSSVAEEKVSGISQQRRIEPAKLKHILRGELDWIVMKALEKDRTRRYDSANSLANDVSNYLNGDIVTARPPSLVYQIQKSFRRHRAAFSVALIILLLLLGGIAGTAYQAVRARQAQVQAQASEKVARDEAARAESAVAELEERRRDAEEARNEAIRQKQEAINQRDRTRQLMNFQASEYALREGDLHEAFARLLAADGYQSNWEYGGVFGRIVDGARKNFVPIARWSIAPGPREGCFVIPKTPDALRKGLGWLILTYPNSIRVHEMRSGKLVSERPFKPAVRTPIGDARDMVPVVVPISSRLPNQQCRVAALSNEGLTLLNVPSLDVAVNVTHHSPRQVQAATHAAIIATLDDQNVIRVLDAQTGKVLAERKTNEVDAVADYSVSPDGNSIVFASFSIRYLPVLWTWPTNVATKLPSASQLNTFTSSDTLLSVKILSSQGNNDALMLNKLEQDRIVMTPIKLSRPLRPTVLSWTSPGRIDLCESNNGSLFIESVLTGSAEDAGVEVEYDKVFGNRGIGPSRISISHSPSSLLPYSRHSENGAAPVFIAVDGSTLAVAIADDQEVQLFVPQPSVLSVIDGVQAPESSAHDLGNFAVNTFLWTTVQRDQLLMTAPNMKSLAIHHLDDDGRPNTIGQFNLEPPEDLNGPGKAIVAVDLSKDGKTAWVLWEGADTFLHTAESQSRDLVVTVYDLQTRATPDQGRTKSLQYENISQRHKFRMSRHSSGGARVLRAFFVDESEKTLVVGNERLTAGYNAETGALLYEVPQTHKIAVGPNRKHFAIGSHRNATPVKVLEAINGRPVFETGAAQKLVQMAVSPKSDSIWVGWESGIVEQYLLATGQLSRSFRSSAAPCVILPEGDRYVGFVLSKGAIGDFVLAEFDTGRRVSTLKQGFHVLTKCESNIAGTCLSFNSKSSVEIINRINATQAVESLKRIDPSHETQWRSRLIDFYGKALAPVSATSAER